MRFLVTGGGGFLGRYLIRELRDRGHEPVAFQRSPHPDLEAAGVECRSGDLTDAEALRRAAAGCAGVFHVAARAGVWGSWESFFKPNVEGTRNVLAACRDAGVRHLVHTSTPSVVFTGEAFEGADETLPYGHHWLGHYAHTKALAEAEVLAAHDGDTLRTVALRPHLIWGVGDPHLVPRVVDRARKGRLRIVGDGRNRVDLTHVRHAARAHWLAFEALREDRCGGRAYFLSDGQPVLLWSWINDLLQRLGMAPVERSISPRTARRIGAILEAVWRTLGLSGEPPMTRFVATELSKSHWFDISAARRDLGYEPWIDGDAGMDELVASIAKAGRRD